MLHDDQKELFEYAYAVVLNVVFVALAALLLWPLGRAGMALHLAKGYWVFWIVLILSATALRAAQRLLRMDIDSRFDAYVLSALAVSAFLQAGWSAFAALAVEHFAADASTGVAAVLYLIGIVSSWIAYAAVSALYMGSLYRLINLGVALVSFVVFSFWPRAAVAIYGWFFELVRSILS
jgi:hypothetical protein